MRSAPRLVRSAARAAVTAATTGTATVLGALLRRPWSVEAARRVLARRRVHLLAHHYYLPIPDPEECDDAFWEASSELVGLDVREEAALRLLEEVVVPRLDEFRATFPDDPDPERPGFFLINGGYMAVDAHVYYALIRHFRPARVVEVGGGSSTVLAAAALRANRRETDAPAELIVIEPHPGPELERHLEGIGELLATKVQDVGLDLFRSLSAGDVLFIDSSHVLRAGGDVQFEYLEVLPRLAPGVLVHVHDVSLPGPYPRVYFEQQLFWNEQYLLQAFLAFNHAFEILWPGTLIAERHPDVVRRVFPEVTAMRERYPHAVPSAFWMRVRP